jgi:hypothetical protein
MRCINDDLLRDKLLKILSIKSRNQVVKEIKLAGEKMHQYNIDRFIQRKPVSLETLKKLDLYVENSPLV